MANKRMIVIVRADSTLGKELAGFVRGRPRVARLRELATTGLQAERASTLGANDRRKLPAVLETPQSHSGTALASDPHHETRGNDGANDDCVVLTIPNVSNFAGGLLDQMLGAELPA